MFDSYYWEQVVIGDPELQGARVRLASEPEVPVEDLLLLLRSGDVAANGVALDHYYYWEVQWRHGADNPFSVYEQEVLECARRILASPAHSKDDLGTAVDGADHASALRSIYGLAGPEDAQIVAAALTNAPSWEVFEAAAGVARGILSISVKMDHVLVQALTAVLFDESRSLAERWAAVRAFNDCQLPDAGEIVSRVLRSNDHGLRVEAAVNLAARHLDRYREDLERLVADWPKDIGYPEAFVLDALSAGDEDE